MNVFITGGTGYVGSGLVPRLMAENKIAKIVVLTRDMDKAHRLTARIGFTGNCEFVTGEIQHYDYELGNIDVIIHLAANNDMKWCQENRSEAFETQVGGTLRLAEAARWFKVPYFIFVSSHVIYGSRGEQDSVLAREDFPLEPTVIKAQTKYVAELAVRSLADSSTKFVILRPTYIYGVNAPRFYEDVTTKFARLCCAGENLPVHGDGTQKIDMVNLRDMCNLIHLLMFSPDETWNQIYNVGGGQPISMNELVDMYAEAAMQIGLKAPSRSYIEAPRKFRPYHLDISKVRQKLGWTPSTSIKDGVTELLRDYLRSHACPGN